MESKPRRRTKIVISLGPSTDRSKTLASLIDQGIDVVRLNMSHGSREDHYRRAKLIRECSQTQGRAIGLLVDLQGPKIRIGGFKDGPIQLRNGKYFSIDSSLGEKDGSEEVVGTTYQDLYKDVKSGDRLLLDDGNIVLEVDSKNEQIIKTKVIVGGELSDSKGINKLGGGLSAEALTEKDKQDIKFAAEIGADYLGVSFVRHAADVENARTLLRAEGSNAHIVSKVERREAVDNMDEIIQASDVIMVARGDLGVEIGDAEVPGVQKTLIRESRIKNTVVITATQMMQSMITSPQPTRAEVSDVSNAVLDGTDAVMLSAESAVGRHPVKVVAAMDRVCLAAEQHRRALISGHRIESQFNSVDETIAMATMYTANHYNIAGILSLTESGASPKWMSRISSGIPIFGVTRSQETEQRMTVYRGVYPVPFDATKLSRGDVNKAAVEELKSLGLVNDGDWLIITKGDFSGIQGGTNSMKIVKVGEVAGEHD